MPSISGNAAIDVLIGLFFLYFLLSIVCSSINEGVAAVLSLRAKYLEKGLRSVLENEQDLKRFYSQPRIKALIKPRGRFSWKDRPPSYISARTFALTLLDTFAPPADPAHSDDLIARAQKQLAAVEKAGGPKELTVVEGMIQDALNDTRNDIDQFRTSLERSFDELMDRVSGWYKRRVQLVLFVLAIALAAVMNADSFLIGQRLWQDPALRSAVVAQATTAVKTGSTVCTATKGESSEQAAVNCVSSVKGFGLPLGWNHDTSPHSTWGVLGKILGLLVTGFALSLGAPFWFDLLGKVANLRGAGPPAQTKTSN